MTKITITANDSSRSDTADSLISTLKGDRVTSYVRGQASCLETDDYFIIIIGYIQDNDYLNSVDKAKFFNQANLAERVKRLNGHFSLIQISKTTEQFIVYTNKSGGNRIYLMQENSSWIISNKLASFDIKGLTLNSQALEEELLYRWITGENSLIDGIYQVPSGHYWQITPESIQQKVCYFTLPEANINKYAGQTLDELADTSQQLLTSALNNMLAPNKKIAVLLSGGVDSSILAALANNAGHQIVAISHRSIQHENTELATAIEFAQTLKIEHRIIDIDDNEIAEAFRQCSLTIEQAPRFQSSVILFILFSKLEHEFSQVVYGEAADTLFGNNAFKRYLHRFFKQQRIKNLAQKVPLFHYVEKILPENGKLKRLLNDTLEKYILHSYQLAVNPHSLSCIQKSLTLTNDNYSFFRLKQDAPNKDDLATELLKLKRFALDTDVDNHFHETAAIAAHFDLELVSPFVDIDVMEFAAHLPLEHTLTSEYVKPILRKIGEKYFSRELMYLPKRGFPAPHLAWLETCLSGYVEDAAKQMDFMPYQQLDSETKWTIAALNIILDEFQIDFHQR